MDTDCVDFCWINNALLATLGQSRSRNIIKFWNWDGITIEIDGKHLAIPNKLKVAESEMVFSLWPNPHKMCGNFLKILIFYCRIRDKVKISSKINPPLDKTGLIQPTHL